MSDDEFRNLQNFGKTIETKVVKEPIKKKTKKPQIKLDKNKVKYAFKKISKKFIFLGIRLKKHKDNIHFRIIRLPNLNFPKRKKDYVKCYRIVEKKKQRGNKNIVIRKRVPFKIDISQINSSKTDLEHLITFTFESGIYFNRQKTTEDHKLKPSIWDFKIK